MSTNTKDSVASIESSDRTPTVTRRVGEDTPPSHAVVAAMAEALGRKVHEISPLYETIDPDAMDDLFGCRHDGTPRTEGRVVFDHGECRVAVEPGRVLVFCD